MKAVSSQVASPADSTYREPIDDWWRNMLRWWWLMLLPPLAATVMSLVASPPPQTYQARLAFAVGVPPAAVVPGSDASAAKVGEALVDDIARIIGGDVFATHVAERLADDGLDGVALASELSATDRHRVAALTATRQVSAAADPAAHAEAVAELEAVALAAMNELQEDGHEWFNILGADDVTLTIVDAPDVSRQPLSLRQRLATPMRLILAAALGVVVAAAAALRDPRLYTRQAASAAAAAPVIGLVPRR